AAAGLVLEVEAAHRILGHAEAGVVHAAEIGAARHRAAVAGAAVKVVGATQIARRAVAVLVHGRGGAAGRCIASVAGAALQRERPGQVLGDAAAEVVLVAEVVAGLHAAGFAGLGEEAGGAPRLSRRQAGAERGAGLDVAGLADGLGRGLVRR